MKSNRNNFMHLIGSYTYCRMMHGAYNVKIENYLYVGKLTVEMLLHEYGDNGVERCRSVSQTARFGV